MNKNHRFLFFRILTAIFLLAAFGLILWGYQDYKNSSTGFPLDSKIAGIPVGGLNQDQAKVRLEEVYLQPVQLSYQGGLIQVSPLDLGLKIDLSSMVDTAAQQAGVQVSLGGYWQWLWGRKNIAPINLPLSAQVDHEVLKRFLQTEIVPRYDQPGKPAMMVPGTTNFTSGESGYRLDVDASAIQIESALLSPMGRKVDLVIFSERAGNANSAVLQAFLQQKLERAGFDGIAEIYIQGLRGSESALHFAVQNKQSFPVDIAFSAASTIKIPVMISALRKVPEPVPTEVLDLLDRMMVLSENPPADTLMDSLLGGNLAPLEVTNDLKKLGLQNTFLAGYFYLGAPLLQLVETPANTRTDITTSPDVYNQTSPGEMGILLKAIYECAQSGQGILIEAFPGEITQEKCQVMADVMKRNKIGVLIEAGLPEGTPVGHKHGWTEESDGLLHSLSDVAVVYSPAADYVLTIFLYDQNQLLFNPANQLIAEISQTVYNFFNINAQASWAFGPTIYRENP